jgi:hypothetical protein
MKALDKFVRARKAVKADRSTEQGIAGHQAAMKALGTAAGWKSENYVTDIQPNDGTFQTSRMAHSSKKITDFSPGATHVGRINKDGEMYVETSRELEKQHYVPEARVKK